jgi:hypothetical protein
MDWMGWDVGEVDLAARNRVLSSDELYEVNRQYWVALNARGTNVPRNRRERVALSLLDGRVHPLDPELRRFGVGFQVHAPFMRDTARLAHGIERARRRVREGKLIPLSPEAVAAYERLGAMAKGWDRR